MARGLWLIGILLLPAAAPRAVRAQVRVELEPVIGVYSGFASFPRPVSPGPFQFPDTLTQGTAVALGGQLMVWPTDRVGVRLFALTARSEVGADQRDLQLRLTRRLRLQGDVRALLYSLALTDGQGLRYPSAFQTDLLAGLGLALSLGGAEVEEE